MATNWLGELANQSLGDFDVSEELDRDLSNLAFKARTDEDASWRLFGQLAWKIERFVRRFQYWDLDPFDLDDVVQESYLVYLDTVQRWRPYYRRGRVTGYLHYFLRVFPHWLAGAVHRWRRPTRVPVVREIQSGARAHLSDEAALVEDFCRNLAPQEATLLRLRLVNGFSVPHAADTMGVARRTAYRRWNRILELGREYLREAG